MTNIAEDVATGRPLTSATLKARTKLPLEQVDYLNLSGMGLSSLNHIEACPKLRTLVARQNRLNYLSDLTCCPELWHVDLISNNVSGMEVDRNDNGTHKSDNGS